jgi:hypothetical protein
MHHQVGCASNECGSPEFRERRFMRKKIYVIGATALLAVAVAIPVNSAQSAISSQTIKSAVTPTKLSKSAKTPTPASIRVDVDANWDSFSGAGNPSPAAVNTDIDFDKDLIFNTKPVKPCVLSKLSGTTTDQAIAACGASKVGTGSASLNGIIGPLTAQVTAFNGTPSGGSSTIYLHTRVSNPPLTTILVGTLSKSPAGAPYGSRLHVPIPAQQLGGGFEVITHFDTTVNKKFKITKKGKKIKSGYVTSTCRDKKIQVQGVFGYGTAPTFAQSSSKTVAAPIQACKQIVPKKK